MPKLRYPLPRTAPRTANIPGWSLAPLLVSVALLVFGTNLQGVILPILGHEHGSGMIAIGLFSSMWSLGVISASALFGIILARFGHVRAFIMLTLGSSVSSLAFIALRPDASWIVLRLINGFCYGGAAAIVEAWVLQCSSSGRAFAHYMIANLIASLCGTLSLDIVRPDGPAPFLLAAITLALSLAPVVWGGMPVPEAPQMFRPRLGLLLRQSTLGVVGSLFSGLATGAIGGLGPIFGMMSGLDMRGNTFMLAANSIGGAVAYAPVALLAGRLGRRTLIAALAAAGVMTCGFIVAAASSLGSAGLVVVMSVFGIIQYPLYGLSVGLACEQARDRPVPAVSSECLLMFGAGTIAGPLIGGQIMRSGAQNLFLMIGTALFALLLLASLGRRTWRRDPAQ